MTFADAIVVHFAFGSPFGVYQITRGVRSGRSAASVAAYFILWPLFAAGFFRAWLASESPSENVTFEVKVNSIRRKIEEAAFSNGNSASIFEFREVFARYTGLTMALNQPKIDPKRQLLEISEHAHIELASACLARREFRRLSLHQAEAGAEFEKLIEGLCEKHRNVESIGSLVHDLAYLLKKAE